MTSKMGAVAATLNERRHLSSKGTFLQSPPITHKQIGPVDPGVGQIIDGNETKMVAIAAILDERWS
jgi:hypothetical protein